MICPPFKGCTPANISQGFGVNPEPYQPNGHTGVDFCSSYGTFLVAPENVKIVGLCDTPATLNTDEGPLERGFGVVMQSIANPNTKYLYWHCLGVFPVKIGDIVLQGQPVAQMGNSGFVMSNGVVVPVDLRNFPNYPGTHTHAEKFEDKTGVRVYQDITKDIDYNIPIKFDTLTTISVLLQKISNILTGK